MLIDAVPSFTWNSINKQGIEKLMVPILYHAEFYQVENIFDENKIYIFFDFVENSVWNPHLVNL